MTKKDTQKKIKSTGGVAPFGYVWKDGTLVVERQEAIVRRLIYELFLKHRRKKTVAQILNESGYRTRKGAKFSDTTVDRLLRDTTAKGVKIIGEEETKVEAIIDRDIWQRANNLLGRQVKKQSNHYFSGLVFCSCGGKMFLLTNSKKYVCRECKKKVEKIVIKEVFLAQLKKFSINPKFFEKNSLNKSSKNQSSLIDFWNYLTRREKRLVIENLVTKILVQSDTIQIKFGINPDSFKAMTFGQQNIETSKPSGSEGNCENKSKTLVIDEPLMSEVQAAKFLGISKMTMMRRRKAKKIKYYRVGFRVLYSKEKHLIPYLEECEK